MTWQQWLPLLAVSVLLIGFAAGFGLVVRDAQRLDHLELRVLSLEVRSLQTPLAVPGVLRGEFDEPLVSPKP